MFKTKPKGLPAIMASFTQVLTDLDTFIVANEAEEKSVASEIEALNKKCSDLADQKLKAQKVRGNISQLIEE